MWSERVGLRIGLVALLSLLTSVGGAESARPTPVAQRSASTPVAHTESVADEPPAPEPVGQADPADPEPADASATSPVTAAPRTWHLVGLGDSVLTQCQCDGVLATYAGAVRDRTGDAIDAHNAADPGWSSADVLWDLQHNGPTRHVVSSADTVVVFAGANDFTRAFDAVAAGAGTSAFRPVASQLEANLSALVTEIRRLAPPGVRVVLCDYWNDFKAGAVAQREYSAARRTAAEEATIATDDAIRSVAEQTRAVYVSTRAAFASHPDVTRLLDPDGDHLSAAGARLVAGAILAADPSVGSESAAQADN
jgi:lysophospholipase L1-like esterase